MTSIPIAERTDRFLLAGEGLSHFWKMYRIRRELLPENSPDLILRHGPGCSASGCTRCISRCYYADFVRQYCSCPRCD